MFGCLKEGSLQASPEYLQLTPELLSHQPNPTLLIHLSAKRADSVKLAF